MSTHLLNHSRIEQNRNDLRRSPSDLSRRDFCKGLGLLGATVLLGGCESFQRLGLHDQPHAEGDSPVLLAADQFEAKVGTVEMARLTAARGIEPTDEFVRRFLVHSPTVQAASRPGGPIGSVLYNPRPVTVASAVNLQLTRGKWEPALLHNDLGEMAASQYVQFGSRTFAAIFPNSVSIVGDDIHRNRSLLQLVVYGNLPSEKIVCTNQDLESLIGRQMAIASQLVHGIYCGAALPPLRSNTIWNANRETPPIPEGTISLALARILTRLEAAGVAVKTITPANPRLHPTGWQDVSEAYRTFAVGQLIEAEQAMLQYAPRNAFERAAVAAVRGEYGPYLDDVMQRLDWGHTCTKTYGEQKQDGRADLLAQPVFVHSEGARKQL